MKRFSTGERLNIYCGASVLAAALGMGLVSVAQFWNGWGSGLIMTVITAHIIIYSNSKKRSLIISEKIADIPFSRICVVDSVFPAAALAFLWLQVYIPVPFTMEEFLHRTSFIFPFGAIVLGALSLIPLILTNKKILAAAAEKGVLQRKEDGK